MTPPRKFAFLILLWASFSLVAQSNAPLLKAAFSKAEAGDFVVLSHQKNLSLLHIFAVEDNHLVIEEISAPSNVKSKVQSNWQNWIDQGAPNHLSWVMYELNLDKKQVQDVYSCSQKSWKKVFPQEQIFPTLLELSFTPIDSSKRKKAGPPPPSTEMIDDRPLWQPPVYFQGQKIKKAVCGAYSAKWPNDGTELSGKVIEVFLVQKPVEIPQYFPVWMQVSDRLAQTKLRVIDSGKHLISPYKHFPIPPLQLSASQYTLSGDLCFHLRAHPKLTSCKVYAKALHEVKAIELQCEAHYDSTTRELVLILPKKELQSKLLYSQKYTFFFEPTSFAHLGIETPQPLKILKSHD